MKKLIPLAAACVAVALMAAVALSDPPKGKATLKLPEKKAGLTAELTTTSGKLAVTSKGVNVKPGTYDVKLVVLSMADDKKNVWTLTSTSNVGSLERFMVDEGQEKIVDVGPPIFFRMRAWRPGVESEVNITCDVVGRSGELYNPGAASAGHKPEPVAYQVVDEDGKTVLASGHMAFKSNMASAVWNPPKGYTKKFTVKIAPEMGPFEWKYFESYTGKSRPDAK